MTTGVCKICKLKGVLVYLLEVGKGKRGVLYDNCITEKKKLLLSSLPTKIPF